MSLVLGMKICPVCGSRMDILMKDEKGILWKCVEKECGYEVNLHYTDTERRAWEHKKASKGE